jgi:rhomboid family GlyGly-CTERM serine protease
MNNSTKQSHGTIWVPWRTLVMSLAAIALFVAGNELVDLLAFDKAMISAGEVWRIITGHFIHYDLDHVFWDVLAFTILGTIIEKEHSRHLIASLLVSLLFVSVWLFVVESQLSLYYGLSGALNGWLAIAVLTKWEQFKERRYLLILFATLLKIAYEVCVQRPLFVTSDIVTIPSSHVAGILGGLAYFGFMKAVDVHKRRMCTIIDTF